MSLSSAWKQLKRYWCIEILGHEHRAFSWRRIRQKCKRSNRYAYVFWYRLAYVMHQSQAEFWRRRAKLLNERISRRYNVEIMLGAQVGEGLWIGHPSGIVVSGYAVIGRNFSIWQNCTVGIKGGGGEKGIFIGDNVRLAAHSCIIGDHIVIGDNVSFGAMSFVNKDVPSSCTYITRKISDVRYSSDRSS
ncbi:MAG: serine acetyltransferase [Aquipseudomonas alcaligenes]|uniref:Serine acetyltransferase n=1 Tax=Aquipseudomonas alcaligenes TaxID=43263 RepID=A0A5C7VUP4_AQUAC|nr:MAG: serine acetyltransferase [Pseudomonas alcaligenes]